MNHDKATPREWRTANVPHRDGGRLVGIIIEEGDPEFGELGLSEPLFWFQKNILGPVNAWDDPSALRNRLEELERKATMEVLEIAAKQEADHA